MTEQEIDQLVAERVLKIMNEAIALDKAAISALIFNRVPCNEALANHPTIAVGSRWGGYTIGLMGILNGLCGTQKIAAQFGVDEVDTITGDLLNFKLNKEVKDVYESGGRPVEKV